MEEGIKFADDLRASNAGTQDLLGTEVHDTMMLRTAETATGKTTSGKKKKGGVPLTKAQIKLISENLELKKSVERSLSGLSRGEAVKAIRQGANLSWQQWCKQFREVMGRRAAKEPFDKVSNEVCSPVDQRPFSMV